MKPQRFSQTGVSYVSFSLWLALFFTLVVNLPVYKELYQVLSQLEAVDPGFVVSVPVFFAAVLNLLFNVFSWPRIAKPFFIALVLVSALVSYAEFNYGSVFDQEMITNIIETDTTEAGSYLSVYSVVWTLLMGVLPALIIYNVKLKQERTVAKLVLKKGASMLVSLLVVAAVAGVFYQDYVSVGRNNKYLVRLIIPTQWVHATNSYIKETYFTTPQPYQQIGLDAKQTPQALQQAEVKPTLLVLVVGETARAQNYPENGYARDTTPFTRELDIVKFEDVASCGTATAISVPCMFSALNRQTFNRQQADNQDNLLDLLQRAQVSVLWKENDGGDKKVAKNVNKIVVDRKRQDAQCQNGSCYDTALLEQFDDNVAAMKDNRVLVLHLMGSHGPTYFRRYPESMSEYQPECAQADIENCSVDEIVNTYDNTLRYTDYVLKKTINKLSSLQERYNTALVYISDHGESLGENGLFLHGMPYSLAPDYQKRVPMWVWMSPGFQQSKHVNYDCLKKEATRKDTYSQDNLFHSVLGVMDVHTQEYQSALDVFRTCRRS